MTRIDAARQDLDHLEGLAAEWADTLDTARQELAGHDADAAARLGGAPSALDEVLDEGERLRSRVAYAERALAAARAAVGPARATLLSAAADEVDRRRDGLQVTLDAHEARTAQLLAAVVEHEGGGDLRAVDRWWYTPERSGVPFTLPRSVLMRREVRQLASLATRLRTHAASRASAEVCEGLLADVFPDGPEAVARRERMEEAERREQEVAAANEQRARVKAAVTARVELLVGPKRHPTAVMNGAAGSLQDVADEDLPGGDRHREWMVRALDAALSNAGRPAGSTAALRVRRQAEAIYAEIVGSVTPERSATDGKAA